MVGGCEGVGGGRGERREERREEGGGRRGEVCIWEGKGVWEKCLV